MVFLNYMGGLGNQMFQYALAKSLKNKGKTVKIVNRRCSEEDRAFELDIFPNIDKSLIKECGIFYKYIGHFFEIFRLKNIEKIENGRLYDRSIMKRNNIYLYGYYQCEKYFNDIREDIMTDFKFSLEDEGLCRMIQRVNGEQSVSIHIRRGDYLDNQDLYGDICTLDYYKQAIEIINSQVDNAKYYVFSDDIEWVKQSGVFKNAVIVDSDCYECAESWMDMCLMSHCKHNIIANSSYSWWGAYLNNNKNKIVVMPKKWDKYGEARGLSCDDYYKI